MTLHDLKIRPSEFIEVNEGRKRFEIRRRGIDETVFKVGDVLVLREATGSKLGAGGSYTGSMTIQVVTYVFRPEEFANFGWDTTPELWVMSLKRWE